MKKIDTSKKARAHHSHWVHLRPYGKRQANKSTRARAKQMSHE